MYEFRTINTDPCKTAGENDITRIDRGWIAPDKILKWQPLGESDEHLLFDNKPTGRMSQKQWDEIKQDMQHKGYTKFHTTPTLPTTRTKRHCH